MNPKETRIEMLTRNGMGGFYICVIAKHVCGKVIPKEDGIAAWNILDDATKTLIADTGSKLVASLVDKEPENDPS